MLTWFMDLRNFELAWLSGLTITLFTSTPVDKSVMIPHPHNGYGEAHKDLFNAGRVRYYTNDVCCIYLKDTAVVESKPHRPQ